MAHKGAPANRQEREPGFKPSMSARYGFDRVFTVLVTAASLLGIVVLAVLLVDVAMDGSRMLSWSFITNPPSQLFPEEGGIYPALIGSVWLLGLTFIISVPLGIGAAPIFELHAAALVPQLHEEIHSFPALVAFRGLF